MHMMVPTPQLFGNLWLCFLYLFIWRRSCVVERMCHPLGPIDWLKRICQQFDRVRCPWRPYVARWKLWLKHLGNGSSNSNDRCSGEVSKADSVLVLTSRILRSYIKTCYALNVLMSWKHLHFNLHFMVKIGRF